MKKVLALTGLVLALAASTSSDAFAQAGLNLSLNDCGEYGIAHTNPNCTSNSGLALSLVGSGMPPPGMDRVVAVEGYIDVETTWAATLSPWWTLDGCRASALQFGFDFRAGPYNCVDFWVGGATGGGGISPLHAAPNRFQIKLVVATPYETQMAPGNEYYLFRVDISRIKSAGTGACAGCTDAACLVLNRLVIDQPAGVGDVIVTYPVARNYVNYSGAFGGVEACPGVVPAQNRTWGQVKSLYR